MKMKMNMMRKTVLGRAALWVAWDLALRSRFVQLFEDFGVADVGPGAGELEGLDEFAGVGKVADGVGELVFAARGFFEAGGEFEDAGAKGVDAGVVPGAGRFAGAGFFAKVGHAPFVVDEDGAAFGDFAGVVFDRD